VTVTGHNPMRALLESHTGINRSTDRVGQPYGRSSVFGYAAPVRAGQRTRGM